MIRNQAKLFAFVWLVFFPFVVDWLLKDKNNYELTEEEIKFINYYKKTWWTILLLIVLVILLFVIWTLIQFELVFFIANILLVLTFVFLFINIFFIFNEKLPFWKNDLSLKIETTYNNEFNINMFFAYAPFLSFYLLLTNKLEEKYRYNLIEANLFYLILFFIWVLNYFLWLRAIFWTILLILIIRAVSLFVWLDFPIIKTFISKLYKKFPYELLIYIEVTVFYLINNLILVLKWKKTLSYSVYFNQIEKFYLQSFPVHNILKKTKKYLFLIISYTIFLLFMLYIIYENLVWWLDFVEIISVVWFAYYFILPIFIEKRVYPIPLISLIIFYILKMF